MQRDFNPRNHQRDFDKRLATVTARGGAPMDNLMPKLKDLFGAILAEIRANEVGTSAWRAEVATSAGAWLCEFAETLSGDLGR